MHIKNSRFTSVSTLLTIFFFALFLGCQKEITDDGGSNPPPPAPGVDDNITVVAGVRGIVIDENERPMAGVTVTSGAHTTTTDRYGVFRFSNINLSKANGHVKVVKTGYFDGHKTFVTTAGRTHNVRIRMLPKTNTGTFQGASGGTVNLGGGAKLVMPAAAVTNAAGVAYNGTVNVAMTWIDPTASNLPEIVPGDLRGIDTSGQERGLQTFGMLGVEITDGGGQPLKIASGKKAELTFPIPASLTGSAPATIDLWHFDEAKGRWKQEGTATKTGNAYVAQVSHFSFWNCDAPFPLINLCMTILNPGSSSAMNNVQVRIVRANGSYGYGRTDSAGNLCGKVPKDEPLVLKILNECDEVVYTQNIGPFSTDAGLGTITVNISAATQVTISGKVVNCSGANVTSGSAIIYTGGAHSYQVPVTNGDFTLTVLRCAAETVNFSVTGVDYATVQQSVPVTGAVVSGTANIGNVQACGTSAAQFIELLIDGELLGFTAPPDNIFISDSLNTPPYAHRYMINVARQTPVSSHVGIGFRCNPSPGTYPLDNLFVTHGGSSSQGIVSASPRVNLTAVGPQGSGFLEGSFNVVLNLGGSNKNVTGNFRVRRP